MLPIFLKGESLEFYIIKFEGKKFSYEEMKKSMSAQFKGSAHLVNLELSSITKLTGESFLAFSMRVKNTVSIAYPDLGSEARKAIAFDKFKDGLTPELRIQILKDENIECIEGALESCVLLETVGKGV
ncbi:hypothetical protein RF11_02364 [Thelohanellus kitauei]|uniref:Uncharacterized protein n=1 Tax=Thelohanellus kitauei TaxID=669202 RepID=A0A0C2N2A5_THEKT|nr:hypothetical protein RF11_02364 [Thelohanellus kitauei]